VESPQSKAAYKEFYKNFRAKERESVEVARKYAEESLLWMTENAKWRYICIHICMYVYIDIKIYIYI
jgi:phage gp46-like protein